MRAAIEELNEVPTTSSSALTKAALEEERIGPRSGLKRKSPDHTYCSGGSNIVSCDREDSDIVAQVSQEVEIK